MKHKRRRQVFVSVPMNGRTPEEIWEDIWKAKENYRRERGWSKMEVTERVNFVTNFRYMPSLEKEARKAKHPPLIFLSKAIWRMAKCDEVIFGGDWMNYRGCLVEHLIWEKYFKKD